MIRATPLEMFPDSKTASALTMIETDVLATVNAIAVEAVPQSRRPVHLPEWRAALFPGRNARAEAHSIPYRPEALVRLDRHSRRASPGSHARLRNAAFQSSAPQASRSRT